MQCWICYDIADDRRRQRLSDVLLDFGKRVEESVFQCLLAPPLAEEMLKRIQRTIEPNSDKVHVLVLCGTCSGKTMKLGIDELNVDSEFSSFSTISERRSALRGDDWE